MEPPMPVKNLFI